MILCLVSKKIDCTLYLQLQFPNGEWCHEVKTREPRHCNAKRLHSNTAGKSQSSNKGNLRILHRGEKSAVNLEDVWS